MADTPPEFLPWLASWVALEFPTLQDKPLWDEYQQRKATEEIARIHRLRGLKQGLNLSLDLFSVIRTRPRVAIDDGNKLLTTTPVPDALAPVTALVIPGPHADPADHNRQQCRRQRLGPAAMHRNRFGRKPVRRRLRRGSHGFRTAEPAVAA